MEMTTSCARILMLEDDALMCRAVARILGRIAEVIPVASCAAANDVLAIGRWSGLVVDLALPDGSGLDWLASARRNGCDTPALVLTNNLGRGFVNDAFDLGAHYACKPAPAESIRRFVETLTARERASETFGLLAASAMRVLDGKDLSPGELELIAATLKGMASKEFVEAQAITSNTYKTRVRNILKKTGARSIGEIRDRVLRDVSLAGERGVVGTTPQG